MTKEVGELKEELSSVAVKNNLKLSEIEESHKLAQQKHQEELTEAKLVLVKYEALKTESEMSLRSLEEKLQQAKQEIIATEKTVAESKERAESQSTAQASSYVELQKKMAEVIT